jgi:SAM-dependent methyltransferase
VTPVRAVSDAWDRAYEAGRYRGEPPVAFVEDILRAAREGGLQGGPGLYIGCGNGRNYVPLVGGGLDLLGLDVSPGAIAQLARRTPERRSRLLVGDLAAIRRTTRFPVVIGIQVFQHGDRRRAHEHIRSAEGLVAPGGLLCVRVNAVGTDVVPAHDVVERGEDGSFTVRYLEGAKRGLDVHFFSRAELESLLASVFDPVPVLPLRPQVTWRTLPETGQWTQWEAIWRRRT